MVPGSSGGLEQIAAAPVNSTASMVRDVVPPRSPGDLPASLAGMNDIEPAATPSHAVIDAEATQMEEAGVDWVRTEMVQQNGTVQFSTYDYWLLTSAPAHHLHVLALLDYATIPDYITHVNAPLQPPNNFNQYILDFANASTRIAQHYGSAIGAYEIYNEENSNYWIWQASNHTETQIWPEQYGKLLTQAYLNIHAADSGATVIMGGLLPPSTDPTSVDTSNNQSVGDYLNLTYGSSTFAWYRTNYGGANPVDGIGLHPYVSNAQMDPLFSHVRATLNVWQPSIPFWVTEFGWQADPNSPGGWGSSQEMNQSVNLTQAYQYFASRTDVATAMWFDWWDWPGGNWGLGGGAPNGTLSYIKNSWMSYYYLFHHDDGKVLSISVPSSVVAGKMFMLNVSVQNTGTSLWSEAGLSLGLPGSIRLGALPANSIPFSAPLCGGYSNSPTDERIYTCGVVAPGSTTYYEATGTAPTTLGTWPIAVGMVHDGVAWFGATLEVNVSVVAAPPPFRVSSFNASVNPVLVNHSTIFTVTTSGGAGSPYTYVYSGLPAGCPSHNASSWSCTPTSSGSFNVSVKVTDAAGNTAGGSLNLTVNSSTNPPPLSILSFSASPNPVSVNSSLVLTAQVSGGTPPYTVSYAGLPAGCSSANQTTLNCTPTTVGNYSVTLGVTDLQGNHASKNLTLKVSPLPFTLVSFAASPSTTSPGNATVLTVKTQGGTTPLSYAYGGLPSPCATKDAATVTCDPQVAGNYTITVNVTDASGVRLGAATNLVVAVPVGYPTIQSFVISPSTLVLGNSTTMSVRVTGGVPPYTFVYRGLPPGCLAANSSVITCVPQSTGTYPITVDLSDTIRHWVQAQQSLEVLPRTSQGLEILRFMASADPVSEGSITQLNVTATGGTPPYTYAYSGLPGGCTSADASSLSCTPRAAGNFTVEVTVSDSHGAVVSVALLLQVTASSTSTLPPSGTWVTQERATLLGLAVVAIVALVLVGVYVRRRKHSQAEENPPPKEEPR